MAHPAFLFLSHRWDATVARRFQRLERETCGQVECHLLLQADAPPGPPLPERTHRFDPAALPSRLNLPTLQAGKLIPGCAHFPLLEFARDHDHPSYWLVEYDVEFTGSWEQLLAWGATTEADLLGAHLEGFEARPDWYWWSSLQAPVEAVRRLKLFLPLYRLSGAGVRTLWDAYRTGWRGHAEALLPTTLHHAGLKVQDLGAIAPAWLPGSTEPWEVHRSSHRWRPEVTLEECRATFQPDCLYHPVKEAWTFEDGAFWRPAPGG